MYKKIIMLLTCGALNATSMKSRLCCHRRNSGTNLAVSSTAKPIGTSLEGPSLDAFLTTRYPRDANRAELEAELDAAQQAYHKAVSEELRPFVERYWEKGDDTYRLAVKNLAKCKWKIRNSSYWYNDQLNRIRSSIFFKIDTGTNPNFWFRYEEDMSKFTTQRISKFVDLQFRNTCDFAYFFKSNILKSEIDEIKSLLNQNLQKIDPDLDCLQCIKKLKAASNEYLSDLDELEKQLFILRDSPNEDLSFFFFYDVDILDTREGREIARIIVPNDNFNLCKGFLDCKRFLEARNALQNYKELLKLKSLSTGIKQEIDKRKKSEKEKADDQQSVNEGQG